MDEDATWYGSRHRRRSHCIRQVPSAPRKGHSTPPPLGPCLLWPRSPISATAELLLAVAGVKLSAFHNFWQKDYLAKRYFTFQRHLMITSTLQVPGKTENCNAHKCGKCSYHCVFLR